jgi:hypothetical protein
MTVDALGMIPVALLDLCQDGGGAPVQTKDPRPPRNRRATEGVVSTSRTDLAAGSEKRSCVGDLPGNGLVSAFERGDASAQGLG